MRPASPRTSTPASPRRSTSSRSSRPLRPALAGVTATALLLSTGCAWLAPTWAAEPRTLGDWPLQATSQPSYVPASAPVARPTQTPAYPFCPLLPGPPVTQPWMEAQLQQLDHRYATAATETRQVFVQSLEALKHVATASDVAPVKQVAASQGRLEQAMSALSTRLQALEQSLADLTAERSAPARAAAPPVDPDTQAFQNALDILQGNPRLTQPLRAWLDQYPTHPKAPQALLALGVAALDTGRRPAALQDFQRLSDQYAASAPAKEARAFLALLPPAKAKPAGPKPAAAPKPAPAARSAAKPIAACDPSIAHCLVPTPESSSAAKRKTPCDPCATSTPSKPQTPPAGQKPAPPASQAAAPASVGPTPAATAPEPGPSLFPPPTPGKPQAAAPARTSTLIPLAAAADRPAPTPARTSSLGVPLSTLGN